MNEKVENCSTLVAWCTIVLTVQTRKFIGFPPQKCRRTEVNLVLLWKFYH
ncbi:MAG: hypothetical protein ACTS44_00800 [Candidatus Hodgkinia cicadicola]